MKKAILTTMAALATTALSAQESQTAYNFLRLPVSAHAAAVGGDNVTIVEDDAALMFSNPALLSSVSDKTIGLNVMTYMAGATTASATFNRTVGERASWAVSGQYMNYGKMRHTDDQQQPVGRVLGARHRRGGLFLVYAQRPLRRWHHGEVPDVAHRRLQLYRCRHRPRTQLLRPRARLVTLDCSKELGADS